MSRPEQLAVQPDPERRHGAHPVSGDVRESSPRPHQRSPVAWVRSGAGYSATIDGNDFRVTRYPADSPLDAPFGAYANGRFIGSGATLDTVKGRCTAHAARIRGRSCNAG
jgi:hypothetical protein